VVIYLCVRGIECLYQASQWSCICVLGVMYLCARGHVSELGVSSTCTRLVSGHVSVC
jgi:hypothetical protein